MVITSFLRFCKLILFRKMVRVCLCNWLLIHPQSFCMTIFQDSRRDVMYFISDARWYCKWSRSSLGSFRFERWHSLRNGVNTLELRRILTLVHSSSNLGDWRDGWDLPVLGLLMVNRQLYLSLSILAVKEEHAKRSIPVDMEIWMMQSILPCPSERCSRWKWVLELEARECTSWWTFDQGLSMKFFSQSNYRSYRSQNWERDV